jgi:hypothetical protein
MKEYIPLVVAFDFIPFEARLQVNNNKGRGSRVGFTTSSTIPEIGDGTKQKEQGKRHNIIRVRICGASNKE